MMIKDIDTLAAGLEMDALVAEKVMGYEVTSLGNLFDRTTGYQSPMPSYSTEISAAWEVAQKVDLLKNCRHLHQYRGRSASGLGPWEWVVEQVLMPLDHNTILGRGETAPLAICRAALRIIDEGQ